VTHTILVVDDNPQIIGLLRKLLAQLNESVLIATSGAEALAALASGAPDLVLLDIQLPDMSGHEVYRRIKATRDIPVIFTTGADLEDVVGGAGLRHEDYVVSKPFDVSELLRLIRQCLAR
jgi:two-component system, OmpR family, response regulator